MEYFKIISGIPIHISDSIKKGVSYSPDKPVLLFLHGYLETLYIWSDFIEKFTDKYRVIAIDLPGHGLSGSFEVNSMERVSGAISSLLNSSEIFSNVVLIGHSMGGYVALDSIKRFPNLFSSVILLHSTPYADSDQKKIEREREIELIKLNKLHQIASLSLSKIFSNSNINRLEDKILELVEISEVHDPEGIVSSIKGIMLREDTSDFFKSLQLPKLIVLGSCDNYITAETSQKMHTSFGSCVITIPQTGHCSFIEAPNELATILSEFLANI